MRVELPCEIVQDLLPTYIDGLANETTAASVEAHMEGCENCRRMYDNMTQPEMTPPAEEDAPAVDFMKRARSKAWQNLIFCTSSAVAIILIVGYIWFFIVGFVTPSSMVDVRLEQTESGFLLNGTILDDHRFVGSETEEEMDGVLDIRLYNTYRIMGNTSFSFPVQPTGPIHRITLNGSTVLWEDGVFIAPGVSRMFEAKTPYVGDAPAVNRVVQVIGLSDVLRGCGMELHTAETPYGITFMPGEAITAEMYEEYRRILPAYGVLLLAEIENLDYVQFDLDVEGKTKSIPVDQERAAAMVNRPMAYWRATAAHLQELVQRLQMLDAPVFAPNADLLTSDNFELGYVIETDDDIYHIGMELVVNGEIHSGGAMGHGNGTPLKGNEFGIGFTPELEGYKIDMAEDTVEVKITLYGEKDDLTDILGEVYVKLDPDDPKYYDGNTYTRDITITGSREAGYHGE